MSQVLTPSSKAARDASCSLDHTQLVFHYLAPAKVENPRFRWCLDHVALVQALGVATGSEGLPPV